MVSQNHRTGSFLRFRTNQRQQPRDERYMRKPTRPLTQRIYERHLVPYQQGSPEPVFCNEHKRPLLRSTALIFRDLMDIGQCCLHSMAQLPVLVNAVMCLIAEVSGIALFHHLTGIRIPLLFPILGRKKGRNPKTHNYRLLLLRFPHRSSYTDFAVAVAAEWSPTAMSSHIWSYFVVRYCPKYARNPVAT